MTRTGEAARPTVEDHTDDFLEWTRAHSRQLSFALLALLTVAFLTYVIVRSSKTKSANAEQALSQAEFALETGQAAAAQTELERIVQRYEGTQAGTQALLRLAQVLYDQGKFQEAIDKLESAAEDHTSGPFAVSVRQILGAGYEGAGRPGEAAATYLDAAERTPLEGERDLLRAQAARAHRHAGNKAEAIRLWRMIAENPASPLVNEARIRLGELTTVPAGS